MAWLELPSCVLATAIPLSRSERLPAGHPETLLSVDETVIATVTADPRVTGFGDTSISIADGSGDVGFSVTMACPIAVRPSSS
jgi:hypothetical protein